MRLATHNLYTVFDDGFEVLSDDVGMKLFPIRTHRDLDDGPFGMSTFLGEFVDSYVLSILVELENEVAEPVPFFLELFAPVEPNTQLLVLRPLGPSTGAVSRTADVRLDALNEIL